MGLILDIVSSQFTSQKSITIRRKRQALGQETAYFQGLRPPVRCPEMRQGPDPTAPKRGCIRPSVCT